MTEQTDMIQTAVPKSQDFYLSKTHKGRMPLWIGALLAITTVIVPQAVQCQQCKGNQNVGCTNAGTSCSPVDIGMGPTGKCTTPVGFPQGELSCVCAGTPVKPPMPANCSNPTSTGQVSCPISEPVVTQKTTGYPILFAPGNRVTVSASGCVQTGGSGLTWKRYVDPAGDNSDRLYHGLIELPGMPLTRIQSVIGQTLTIPAWGFLTLGYEDDNYTDNGYTKPDNGTGNQCKGIGPAQVTLTISR